MSSRRSAGVRAAHSLDLLQARCWRGAPNGGDIYHLAAHI
jgi:hypothetical protein